MKNKTAADYTTAFLSEILDFLDWKNAYSNKEEFNKTIKGLLYLFGQGLTFDRSIITKKLTPPGMTFSLTKMKRIHPLHDLFGGEKQYADYILALFEKHAQPGNSFLEYLYIVATESGELPLMSEQVIDIQRSFDKSLQEESKFTMDIFMLYANLLNLTNQEGLTQQLKNFIIAKDIDGFIEAVIQPSPIDKAGKYWIASFVREIFGAVDNFIKAPEFIDKETQQRKAFLDLYHTIKSSHGQDAVFNLNDYYRVEK